MNTQEDEPTSRLRPRNVRVEAAAATHIGLRTTNADAFLSDQAAGLYAVTDGMGDTPRSRLVAQMGLAAIHELFQPWARIPVDERSVDEARERLLIGMARAHDLLHSVSRASRNRIGAAVAVVVVCEESLVVGHLGDARVHLLPARSGRLVQLTDDHTVAGAARLRGMPADEAARLPDAAKLTQALGATRAFDPKPIVQRWEPGDMALLCTDGVSDRVEADAITSILLDAGHIGMAVQGLVDRAIELGGPDNATAVLVHRTV